MLLKASHAFMPRGQADKNQYFGLYYRTEPLKPSSRRVVSYRAGMGTKSGDLANEAATPVIFLILQHTITDVTIFWQEAASVWFTILEAQFMPHRLHRQDLRYSILCQWLREEVATEVSDVILGHLSDPLRICNEPSGHNTLELHFFPEASPSYEPAGTVTVARQIENWTTRHVVIGAVEFTSAEELHEQAIMPIKPTVRTRNMHISPSLSLPSRRTLKYLNYAHVRQVPKPSPDTMSAKLKRTCSTQRLKLVHMYLVAALADSSLTTDHRKLRPCRSAYLGLHQFTPQKMHCPSFFDVGRGVAMPRGHVSKYQYVSLYK